MPKHKKSKKSSINELIEKLEDKSEKKLEDKSEKKLEDKSEKKIRR